MLGEITFNKFRFFNNNQTLSLFPDLRTKKLASNSIKIDDKNVLKTLSLYGSNNSGKTNVLELLELTKMVLLGEEKVCFNSKTLDDSPIVDISLTFNNNDDKGWYKYSFSFNHEKMSFIKESLSHIKYYEDGAPIEKNIFVKDIENRTLLIFGSDESPLLDLISSRKPLLYTLNLEEGKYSNLKGYFDSVRIFAKSIVVIRMYNIPIDNTVNSMKGNDKNKKKFITNFVKNADLTIDDFAYSEKPLFQIQKQQNVDEKVLNEISQLEEASHLSTKYKGKNVPSLFFDSTGTKKVQAIASFIYDCLKQGQLLVVDELDNGLHYKLTRAIVSAFNNIANKKGQLVFSAHDLLLVGNNNLLRKDQIYFLSRENDKASLFWLKNATVLDGGPRDVTAVLKRYNHGDFVKVPMPSFVDDVLSIINEE